MARETRVGLLAGLAFIICFAVILANRGRQDPPLASPGQVNDSGLGLPQAVQRVATNSQDRSRTAEQGPLASRDKLTTPGAASAPGTNERTLESTIRAPASGADLLFPDAGRSGGLRPSGSGAEAAPSVSTSRPSGAGESPPGLSSPIAGRVGERVLTSASLSPAAFPVDPSSVETAPKLRGGAPDSGPVASDRSRQVGGIPYTVQPGDTLSKIAAANYGNKFRATVDGIFDANRSLLSSPDAVKAGMVLLLPGKGSSGGATTTEQPSPPGLRAPPRSEDSKKNREPTETAFRWYQVKKNDRYMSIAREQLGDAARWKELHLLNRDKFPDPGRIREGVRIKLPAVKGLALAEPRR